MRFAQLLPAGGKPRRIKSGIARGAQMSIDFHRGQTRLYLGLYECELNRHIRRLVTPGMPTFDIGGEYGYDALALARLTRAPVVSVECDIDLCAEIRNNASLNTWLADLVTVRHAFIGSGAGEVSLDELVTSSFVPGFVKMDIEGGEARALQASPVLLTTHRPSLLVEVHGEEVEESCLMTLRAVDYGVTTVSPRTWLADYRPLSHNRWLVAIPN